MAGDAHCCGCYGQTAITLVPRHKIVGVSIDQKRFCCCFSRSVVTFSMKTFDGATTLGAVNEVMKCCGLCGGPSAHDSTLSIKVIGLSDAAILFDYVYESLHKSNVSSNAHVLSHLINDGLLHKAQTTSNFALHPATTPLEMGRA